MTFEPITPPFATKRPSPTTNLGTAELRANHAVMIEPGNIPRARVMDQHVIDRYLIDRLLSLGQHRAGELLLLQATIAGIWPTGINWGGSGGTGGRKNYVPFGIFLFGRSLKKIASALGNDHARIVSEVICRNTDVSSSELQMTCLQQGLDLIDATKLRAHPMALLRQTAKKERQKALS